MDDAVKELRALATRDSAVVGRRWRRLSRSEEADLARAEVEKALKLAPNYTEEATARTFAEFQAA